MGHHLVVNWCKLTLLIPGLQVHIVGTLCHGLDPHNREALPHIAKKRTGQALEVINAVSKHSNLAVRYQLTQWNTSKIRKQSISVNDWKPETPEICIYVLASPYKRCRPWPAKKVAMMQKRAAWNPWQTTIHFPQEDLQAQQETSPRGAVMIGALHKVCYSNHHNSPT